MKTVCLTLTLLLTFHFSQAQKSRTKFGVNLTSRFSQPLLNDIQAFDFTNKKRVPFDKGVATFNVNVMLQLQFNSRLTIGAGFGYVSYGIQTQKIEMPFPSFVFPQRTIKNQDVTHAKWKYISHYFELPALVRIYGNDRFYLYNIQSLLLHLGDALTRVSFVNNKVFDRVLIDPAGESGRIINFATTLGVGYEILEEATFNWHVEPHVHLGPFHVRALREGYFMTFLSLGLTSGIKF